MKKIFIILVILCCTFIQAQKEPVVSGELSFYIKNNPQRKNVSLTLELISPACWDEEHYLTELFNGGTISDTINNGWLEFHVCWSTAPQAYYKTFGLGLYKVTAKIDNVTKAHFFIDYRTSDLPGAIWYTPPPGCQIDYAIDFNVETGKFYFRYTQDEFFGYHAFWTLRPCVSLFTDGLENYWENSLAVFNNGTDHPMFAWGPYPGSSNNYYKIYKKKGTQNFVLYDSTTANTYVDENELIITHPHANEGYIYYKITSVGYPTENPFAPPYESEFSNTVDIWGILPPIEKKNGNLVSITDYSLMQNYPNPFNPSTIISYQTPKNEFVTLKVFNVLGREVAHLVNSYKEAGTHSVEFDGSALSSGMYIYTIQIGSYIESRKLILQK
jgi:hypothetical protein